MSDSPKVDALIQGWIKENISVSEIGKKLKEGLDAIKFVYKEEQIDYATRLAYIDWIAEKGGYVPEKKIGGGTFSMAAPSQSEVDKAFGEKRPEDE